MEQEMKYAISSKQAAEDLWQDETVTRCADASTEETLVMKAVYFDTEDRILSANNMTFRVRAEGTKSFATIKWGGCSANGFHDRNEINVPVSEDISFIKPSVDMFKGSEEGEILAKLIADKPLVNLLETRFLRRQERLNYKDTLIELSIDTGAIVTDNGEAPILELELELYAGNVEHIKELGAVLAAKHDIAPEDRSKFARGLALLDQ